MKLRMAASLVLATFALGCAGDDVEDGDELDTPAAMEAEPAPAPVDEFVEQTLEFMSVGGAPVTGEVEVDDDGNEVEADVVIRGSTAGAVHQGHIHAGRCSAVGAVVQALEPVTIGEDGEGTAENRIALPPATVLNGDHVVQYHEANGNPGAAVLCVDLPALSGSATTTTGM